uniref:Uncharacterized protein n=1 Tax=Cyanoptyche gloeocystis TaxID=77922 RepID=A0A096Y6Y0_9EUKA|nr:hypothetical protein NX25_p07 [Cyanoptyche gloeocystis]AIM52088.1 hypothetical protein [Cyanoptyche gloeocystis]
MIYYKKKVNAFYINKQIKIKFSFGYNYKKANNKLIYLKNQIYKCMHKDLDNVKNIFFYKKKKKLFNTKFYEFK